MDKTLSTMPLSDMRTCPAAILAKLSETPVLLTQNGHGAGVLVHPDRWNEIVELLTDYDDILIARQRIQEAETDSSVMRPIADLHTSLQADGLLDD